MPKPKPMPPQVVPFRIEGHGADAVATQVASQLPSDVESIPGCDKAAVLRGVMALVRLHPRDPHSDCFVETFKNRQVPVHPTNHNMKDDALRLDCFVQTSESESSRLLDLHSYLPGLLSCTRRCSFFLPSVSNPLFEMEITIAPPKDGGGRPAQPGLKRVFAMIAAQAYDEAARKAARAAEAEAATWRAVSCVAPRERIREISAQAVCQCSSCDSASCPFVPPTSTVPVPVRDGVSLRLCGCLR
jgi:hypothetical protein